MPFEWSPSILMGGFLLIAIVILNLITLLRLHALQKAVAAGGLQELLMMLRNQQAALTEGFSESRRELREVSAENRRELQEAFKILQDTLIRRIVENHGSQAAQMDAFKNTLRHVGKIDQQCQRIQGKRQSVVSGDRRCIEPETGRFSG
ncbi:MAG TPA: hypothetical protein VLS45_05255 [Methylomicrobium sp.]|nr:hypothetical protein [Methylomicrobium sp.]